jgi:hypothetical protein
MILSQVFEGVGLGAYGVAFYAVSRWYTRDDERLQKMAQSRWRWDRFTTPKLRRGEISKEEWFDRFARSQRAIVKWGFTPIIILWLVLCLATTIHGLVSHG